MTDLSDRPLCKCHGEPQHRHGKYWRCAVNNTSSVKAWQWANREHYLAYQRDRYAANREKILAYRRDRYDSDPVFRIGNSLKASARSRAQTLERMQERVLANG